MAASEKRSFSLPVERRLKDEVALVVAAMRADPTRAIPADEVFADIRALHAKRAKASAVRGA